MISGSCPVERSSRTASGCPVSPNAAAFDPFGALYQADPPESLRWSRADEPVFYSPEIGYWVVTRYTDVKTVFQDNQLFSPSIALEKITPVCEEAIATLDRYGYAMARTLVNEDEPDHMPRRRALMRPFIPSELTHHEPVVRRLTRQYVDGFIERGKADLVDEMLWEVPLTVALHFLGVPEEDMATLREYSIAHTVNTWGRPTPDEQVAVAESVGKFWRFAGEVLDKMRQDPTGPGWMPYSIRLQQDLPDIITDSYLHSMMMAGIVAAHETTANAAANAIKLLLENRAVWEEICAEPELIPNAVEECLRHNGSVAAWRRLVTADTEIAGVPIPEGAKLLIVNSSANHDERHFDDPDELDVRRENVSEHLTFGYGSHQCLGKNLARMELQIFLEEFTTRLPHMELVPDQRFTYLPNTSFRGPEHLWVRWDPDRNPERRDSVVLRDRRQPRIGEPSKSVTTRTVVVESIAVEADRIRTLTLVPTEGHDLPAWSPGAHLDIELNGLSRQYSLCGEPVSATRYQIAVLDEPEGRGGSRYVHEELAVGRALRIRGPRNYFRLDPDADRYLFIAGGIGITPIIAMADAARASGKEYWIHYCGRDRTAMAFLQRIRQDHGDRVSVHVTSEGSRLDLDQSLAAPVAGTAMYACGPRRMLEALEAASRHWPDDTVHIEHFGAVNQQLDPDNEREFDVELVDSQLTIRVAANQTVLSALRQANVDVQSDCEEGLCGTCEVPVLDGEVDHRDLVLTKRERGANDRMMTCCSRAHGERITVGL